MRHVAAIAMQVEAVPAEPEEEGAHGLERRVERPSNSDSLAACQVMPSQAREGGERGA